MDCPNADHGFLETVHVHQRNDAQNIRAVGFVINMWTRVRMPGGATSPSA
jgi:hypothetical protein